MSRSKKKSKKELSVVESTWRAAVASGETTDSLEGWRCWMSSEYSHILDDEGEYETMENILKKLETWQNALRVLRGLTPHERKHHFDMWSWGLKTPCGTVACLAGHCAFDPWFNKERKFKGVWKKIDPRIEAPVEGATHELTFDRDMAETFGEHGSDAILHATSATYKEVVVKVKDYIQDLKEFIKNYS